MVRFVQSRVGGATALEQVKDFIIAQSPRAICDDCIADRLNLSVRQHANHKTRELEKTLGFDWRVQVCAICGSEKKAIRHAQKLQRRKAPRDVNACAVMIAPIATGEETETLPNHHRP